MSAENYAFEEDNVIERIDFAVFGNAEIKRYSAVSKDPYGINLAETDENGEPKRGGVIDLRLGTTDNSLDCATCGEPAIDCPGHPGHTELAEAVFHVGFIEDYVKPILGCICIRCSKLLIYKNEDQIKEIIALKSGKARFKDIKRITSNIQYCLRPDGCGVPVPKIKVEIKKNSALVQIIAETDMSSLQTEEEGVVFDGKKKKIKEIITPEVCFDIMKNISDMDCLAMGLDPKVTRPEDLIIKNFVIPPVAMRPSVKLDVMGATPFEDTMIHKLIDVIRHNVKLRKEKDKELTSGEESKNTKEAAILLQYHVATFYDNDKLSLPRSEQKSSGRPYKSISERIKGKAGRIRGNLMGKRVDFSGRTVITSDPNIGIDQVGIPDKIAMNLTFPEIVTPENYDEMIKLIRNGRYNHPGANYVIPESAVGMTRKYHIDLRYRQKTVKLKYGMIVERHLRNDDHVLFNRQPSLHKLSMMGHRAHIIRNKKLNTFRLNVNVTTPYNADFDGKFAVVDMKMFASPSYIGRHSRIAGRS